MHPPPFLPCTPFPAPQLLPSPRGCLIASITERGGSFADGGGGDGRVPGPPHRHRGTGGRRSYIPQPFNPVVLVHLQSWATRQQSSSHAAAVPSTPCPSARSCRCLPVMPATGSAYWAVRSSLTTTGKARGQGASIGMMGFGGNQWLCVFLVFAKGVKGKDLTVVPYTGA